MSYLTKIPIDAESTPPAYDIHILYCLGKGYNPVHYIQCIGRQCSECSKDNLYRVCPGCGAALKNSCDIYECSCGTAIRECCDANGPLVARYATPNKMFTTEEDVI